MIKVLTRDNFKSMPWKNGGGSTCELFKIPHPTSPERFLFRLSRAQVEKSGPFSRFENTDRILLLLRGNGFHLHMKKETITMDRPFTPFSFKGEDEINCELLHEACEDFNVMIDRHWGKTDLTVHHLKAGETFKLKKPHPIFLYQVDGEILHGGASLYPHNLIEIQGSAFDSQVTRDSTLLQIDLIKF